MPRETVRTTWNEVEIRKKFSSGSKHRLQYRKWKTQTDEKAWTVWRPALWLKLKITCLWWARWKISSCDYRHHPVCRGYKSGNRCIHGYRCPCRQADGKSNLSARSKISDSRSSCDPERKKKRPRLCISKLSANEFYSTESWRIGIERFRMHLIRIKSGKEKWTSWAKSLRARCWGTTTWGNLTTSRLYEQSSVEFGEKMCQLKPNIKLRFILLAQCWARGNWAQIQWMRRSKTP